MRILLIGSVFPRSPSDDQVPWLREICRRVKEAGHQVEFLAPAHRGLRSHTIDGIRVHRFRYAPDAWETLTGEEGAPAKMRRNPLLKLLAVAYLWCGFWALAWLLFRNLFARTHYDLVEVHWPFPHAFVALPALLAGLPIIYHYHSAELKLAAKNKLSNALLAGSLSWACAHVANSSYTAGLIKKVNPALSPQVIAYGSPLKLAAPIASRAAPRRKLLFVGRHIERKGLAYLLDAMSLLPADFTLTLVGEGDQTPALKKQAAELGLSSRVIFPGRLSSEALASAYLSHDFFVLPAIVDRSGDTEGLGVVLIEAVAAGLPLVASNIGGIPDVVLHERTGLLVPAKNPQALASAIQKLSADEAFCQQLTASAALHARENFSWEAVTQQTLALYEKVGKRNNGTIEQ